MKALTKCFLYPIFILMGTTVGGIIIVFALAGIGMLVE